MANIFKEVLQYPTVLHEAPNQKLLLVGDSQIASEHLSDARRNFNGASIPVRTKFKPSSVILRRFDYYELNFPGRSPGFVSDVLPTVDFGDLKFDRIYICISNVDNLNALTPQQVQFQAFQNASRFVTMIHFIYSKLRHTRSKLHLVLPPPVVPPLCVMMSTFPI